MKSTKQMYKNGQRAQVQMLTPRPGMTVEMMQNSNRADRRKAAKVQKRFLAIGMGHSPALTPAEKAFKASLKGNRNGAV